MLCKIVAPGIKNTHMQVWPDLDDGVLHVVLMNIKLAVPLWMTTCPYLQTTAYS